MTAVCGGKGSDSEARDIVRQGLMRKVKENKFPPGWDEERVRRVLAHYEEQTEAEAAAEGEAAFEDRKAIREIAEDEKRQKAIRAVGLRNAGRRADEAQ